MPYFVLTYVTGPGFAEKRAPYRREHLMLVNEYVDAGELLLGGATGQEKNGAMLVFKCQSEETVRGFVAQDPYVKRGLVKHWMVWPWDVVAGSLF